MEPSPGFRRRARVAASPDRLLVLLSALIACGLALHARPAGAGGVEVGIPSVPVAGGVAIRLPLTWRAFTPAKVRVYVRRAGATRYRQLPPEAVAPDGRAVVVPAVLVGPPGVELYLVAADAAGFATTSPPVDPSHRPHRIPVKPAGRLELISPDPTREVPGSALEIRVRGPGPGRFRVVQLDRTDLTALARVTDREIAVVPPEPPDPGEHRIIVAWATPEGDLVTREWTIRVAAEPLRREVFARGGVSLRYAVPVRSSSGSPRPVADGNLGLSFGGRGDGWDAGWNGVNVQYVRDRAGDDLTLASGFAFDLEAGGQRTEYGDVTVQEAPLVAPSFARRGVLAELRGWGTEFHVFRVSAVAVSGWESGLASSGGEITGVSVGRSLLADGGLPVTVVYVRGENRGVDGVDSAGGLAPSQGDVLGVSASFRVLGAEVRGEFAHSRFDPDTRDGQGEDRDTALELTLASSVGPVELGLGYHRYGTGFASIANPTFTADREGVTGRVGIPWGVGRVGLDLTHEWDNLSWEPDRGRVYSTTGALSWSYNGPDGPGLSLTVRRSVQYSRSTPSGAQDVHNTDDSATGGLSLAGEGWSAGLSGGLTRLRDQDEGTETQTRSGSVSGQYAPSPGCSLGTAFTLNRTLGEGSQQTSRVVVLTGRVPLFSESWSASFHLSHAANVSSDRTQDDVTLSGSWRVAWDVGQVGGWFDRLPWSLALSGSYARTDDRTTAGEDSVDVRVLLSVEASLPVDLGAGF
ncbi:MAG: hypothetical protein GXP50_06975 [Deltaproteobacteria bacterium]|nr:hypothetical protein [Deltaproteobacteria bacterium]